MFVFHEYKNNDWVQDSKTQTRGFEQTISTALHLVGFQSEGCEAHNSSKGLLKLYFGVFGSSPAKCPSVTVGQFM